MNKLTVVDIKEKEELEPMLASDLDLVEDGLVLLARQMPTDTGHLDMLAVDSDGALVVIELKACIDEGHLMQGLRYYDWVVTHSAWIADAHKNKGIDPKESCRLVLVAPGFDEVTKKITKYFDVEVDLKEYTCVELKDGTRTLICKSIDIPPRPQPPNIYTILEKLQLIQDEKVRELCQEALDYLCEHEVETRPIYGGWISCWLKGKRFMRICCKKKFFVCKVLQADGDWTGRIRISTRKDWDELYSTRIRPACDRIIDEPA